MVKVYCIFGTLCLVAMLHVFLLFQESCGRSLEEMNDVFDNESIWAFKVKHVPIQFNKEVEAAKKDIEAGKEGVILEESK